MTPLLIYQLKTGFCLMLFISLYYLLFRRETFYHFNRYYLLTILLISVLLPAINIPVDITGNKEILTYLIKSVTITPGSVTDIQVHPAQAGKIGQIIYLTISLVYASFLLFQLIKLFITIIRKGSFNLGSFKVITLPDNAQSFSFFGYLFLASRKTQDIESNQVLQHEIAHARQWHSLDILLLQLIKIFQWFNPFIYLTEKALQETHEYLADASVLEQNGESERYKLLLISQVFGVQPGIFSFFNYSLIKSRLTMMTKNRSPHRNRYKYFAILPLIIVLVLVMCCKESKKLAPPPPPPPPPAAIQPESDSSFVVVDEQAMFQGGTLENFRAWVQKNLVYPADAIKNGIRGKVLVEFSVNETGKVVDAAVLRGVDPLLDDETLRVILLSPAWTPAKLDGEPVKQKFVIPVIFQLQ
jgi:TonB family protein